MSHKESIYGDAIDREECSARDLNQTRRYVLEALSSVKSSKKKGLPGILRLVMLARLP